MQVRVHPFLLPFCVATVLLGDCNRQPAPDLSPTFCETFLLRSMLDDAIYANTPDKDTQAIRPDAEALRRNLDHHSAGGGPSSPENQASFQRFRSFVKKKCKGRDIGESLTDLARDIR